MNLHFLIFTLYGTISSHIPFIETWTKHWFLRILHARLWPSIAEGLMIYFADRCRHFPSTIILSLGCLCCLHLPVNNNYFQPKNIKRVILIPNYYYHNWYVNLWKKYNGIFLKIDLQVDFALSRLICKSISHYQDWLVIRFNKQNFSQLNLKTTNWRRHKTMTWARNVIF